MRWLGLSCLLLLTACATTRQITITAKPSDSVISVDNGAQRGMGQLTATISFRGASDLHTATASRHGYPDKSVTLRRDDLATGIEIDLDPYHKRMNFSVVPVPALITVDGMPIASGEVTQASTIQNFTLDEQDNWNKYTVVATREGWDPAKITVTYSDPSPDYVLQLQPKRKDITITTDPPGATVSVEDNPAGTSPAVVKGLEFPFDNNNNQFPVKRIKVDKPGYDTLEKDISWDDGKTDYQIELIPHQKTVRILTDPNGATVTIDGNPAPPGPDGVPTAPLTYLPLNDAGDLPVHIATISKKTDETEWYPTTMPIAWEEGRTEYSVSLREIMTRRVPLVSVDPERDADGVWQMVPRESETTAMKDVGEGAGKDAPTLLFQAPKGSSIGSLAVNPNGGQIVFTVLSGNTKLDFRSQILAINTTGPGSLLEVTDGKSLDVMPSFTPDGLQIVFSSNRAGRRLNVWRKSLGGSVGIEQLTSYEEQDLWPMIDALPKPRVFYEVLSDSQPDPQLYVGPVDGGGTRTDLTMIPVSQPRVSPRADSVLFVTVNERTGNREIYRIGDKGGSPIDLTNDPDSDCYDPAWSKDGTMIAYTCDRAFAVYPVLDGGRVVDQRHRNADIWVMDIIHSTPPVQITSNGSVDDCPVWDPSGNFIYFRSNRGGQWGIWKTAAR
jgi:hypothetical protein